MDLFEIKPDIKYLETAISHSNILIKQFWDDTSSSFYFTSNDHESLIIRPKTNYDLSMPSGNSVACGVLLRLYHIIHEEEYLRITKKILEKQVQLAAENPFAFGYLLNIVYMFLQKPTEITILGPENSEISDVLEKKFLPDSIIIKIIDRNSLDALSKYEFFSGKSFNQSKTTVYVCKNSTCSLPLEQLNDIEKHL